MMMKNQTVFPTKLPASGRMDHIPVFKSFIETIKNDIEAADEASFWHCQAAFQRLLRSDFLIQLVNYELDQIASKGNYIPFGGGSEFDLTIALEQYYSLHIKYLEPGMVLSNKLYSNTQNLMVGSFAFDGAGEVITEIFVQQEPFTNELMNFTCPLEFSGKAHIVPGDILPVKAVSSVFRVMSVTAPVVIAVFASRELAALRWEYDLNTLLPLRAISSSPNAARLMYTAQMLSEIGNTSSIAPLKSLLQHEAHYVRWSAVKAVYDLDEQEGIRLLTASLTDPHPHIRNAAQKSLAAIKK